MRSARFPMFLIATLFFTSASLCHGQTMPWTSRPVNIQDTRGVVFSIQWDTCNGIASVAALVTKGGSTVANPSFATTDVKGTKANWQVFLPNCNKGDTVIVGVSALDMNGVVIASANPAVGVKLSN